ncbi:MAG TPA: hypothetical protein VMM36_01110 [Opitutaceae bacterium]|nr:hypothetical protein [Opitutaceae bacterium]
MRGPGTISMLLPTIVATLFMFTVVITLNKASSLTRGGKIVRLMNVDDVFPTPESVEQNRKKEFWELTVPPPSPDAVLEAVSGESTLPVLIEGSLQRRATSRLLLPQPDPMWEHRVLEIDDSKPLTPPQRQLPLEYGALEFDGPMPSASAQSRPASRATSVPTPRIQPPAVAPDTSLPVATPTP